MTDGVLIGHGFDGSPQYVGHTLTTYGLTPARIVVNGSESPGAYSIYSQANVKGNVSYSNYLAIASGNFHWITGTHQDLLVNSVKVYGKTLAFVVSRVKNTASDGRVFTAGAVTFLNAGTWYYNQENKTVKYAASISVELLVCSSLDKDIDAYKANHNQRACGGF
jgi:hypothetical protein